MNKKFQISIYLDKRRVKNSNLYPVKLRVYANEIKKQKLYPTKYDLTEKEFQQIWETQKPRKEFQEQRLELQALENKANEVANQINPFTLEKFENKIKIKAGEGQNLIYHYNNIIKAKEKLNRYGTANNYTYSLKSIIGFYKYKKGLDVDPNKIFFNEITIEWLEQYETYILNNNQSRTSIGFYLRPLKAVFNIAINQNEISSDLYPFGRNKYQIPAPKKVKKALSKEQLKTLFEAKPRTKEQKMAKDFWFFSYSCNGMNVKDIVLLKHEDIQNDKIVYYRAKTINTSKTDLKPITVYLNEYSRSIIVKYGSKNLSKKEFVFPIITSKLNEKDKHSKVKNFVRFINQNLKKLTIANKLPSDISTYWARHSWATNAIRNGANMEFISEALNHSDMKTTKNYIAGFEDEVKKEFSNNLMNF